MQYDEGGYIVWANGELLDGVNNDVKGIDAERLVQPRRLRATRTSGSIGRRGRERRLGAPTR